MSDVIKQKFTNQEITKVLCNESPKIRGMMDAYAVKDATGKVLKYNLQEFATASTQVELNEWLTVLFNKIGRQRIFDPMKDFENEFNFLFRDGNELASSEEEISVGLVADEEYDGTGTNPFEIHDPEVFVQEEYTTIKKVWPITIASTIIKRAFISEYGVEDFLALVTSRLAKSRDLFMYNETIALLKTIKKQYQVGKITGVGDATGSRDAYEGLIKMVTDLSKPSKLYNENGQDAVLGKGKGILVLNSTYNASFDVNVLASLLNSKEIGKNKYFDRVIVMTDESFDPNCVGYYFDRDAVMLVNDIFKTESLYNPKNMKTNFWLHNWYKKIVNKAVTCVKLVTEVA